MSSFTGWIQRRFAFYGLDPISSWRASLDKQLQPGDVRHCASQVNHHLPLSPSTVAWIRLWARQSYPLHFSCNALELGPAKFCHPVKNTDANLCFSLLIVKMSRFEFGPDHSLPSADLGLSATALVVAGGFLPCHPPFGLDFCNGDRGQVEPAPIEGWQRQSWEVG